MWRYRRYKVPTIWSCSLVTLEPRTSGSRKCPQIIRLGSRDRTIAIVIYIPKGVVFACVRFCESERHHQLLKISWCTWWALRGYIASLASNSRISGWCVIGCHVVGMLPASGAMSSRLAICLGDSNRRRMVRHGSLASLVRPSSTAAVERPKCNFHCLW